MFIFTVYLFLYYVVLLGYNIQLVMFAPGKEEGLRFGDIDNYGESGPYHYNTEFISWSESDFIDGVNYRMVSLTDQGNKLKGRGTFKVCIWVLFIVVFLSFLNCIIFNFNVCTLYVFAAVRLV